MDVGAWQGWLLDWRPRGGRTLCICDWKTGRGACHSRRREHGCIALPYLHPPSKFGVKTRKKSHNSLLLVLEYYITIIVFPESYYVCRSLMMMPRALWKPLPWSIKTVCASKDYRTPLRVSGLSLMFAEGPKRFFFFLRGRSYLAHLPSSTCRGMTPASARPPGPSGMVNHESHRNFQFVR